MIVAVRILGDAARAHDVHLRRDLVAGTEPGGGHQGDDLVGVVVHERLGVANGELLERIPHAVVRPGLGEVVTNGLRAGALVGDHVVEDGGGPVDDIEIGEGSLYDDDAWSRRQRPRQLGLDSESIGLVAGGLPESVGVVDHHIPLDVVGVVEVPDCRLLLEHGGEVLQPAVALTQVGTAEETGRIRSGGHSIPLALVVRRPLDRETRSNRCPKR